MIKTFNNKQVLFKYLTEDMVDALEEQIAEFEDKYGVINMDLFANNKVTYKIFKDEYDNADEFTPQVVISGIEEDDIVFEYCEKTFTKLSECINYSHDMYRYLCFKMINNEIDNF